MATQPSPYRVVAPPPRSDVRVRRVLALLPLVVVYALLVAAVVAAARGVADQIALDHPGRPAIEMADATAFRVMSSGSPEYELRYRFTVGSREYTAADSFGRHDLWEEVPENDWKVAKVTGRIAIFYLPEDPDVSCPVARARGAMPLGDAVAGFAVFAFFALIGLAGWVVFAARLRAAFVRRRIGVDPDHFLFG